MMKVKSLFQDQDKPVASKKLMANGKGNLLAISLLSRSELPKHSTPVPATLILLEGEALYEELVEAGKSMTLKAGTLVEIPHEVPHRLVAGEDGALLILAQ